MKQRACPHCHEVGTLNRHGFLTGYVASVVDLKQRGYRIYCSNRHKRQGCGRTFSIFMAHVIRNFAITTMQLYAFVFSIVNGCAIKHAWQAEEGLFRPANKTLYRIYQRFRQRLSHIRTTLTLNNKALQNLDFPSSVAETLAHIQFSLPEQSACLFTRFQTCFDTSIL